MRRIRNREKKREIRGQKGESTLNRKNQKRTDVETLTFGTHSTIIETLLNAGVLHQFCQSIESVVVIVYISSVDFEVGNHIEEDVAELLSTAIPHFHAVFELL
jgi:hypothetical protein